MRIRLLTFMPYRCHSSLWFGSGSDFSPADPDPHQGGANLPPLAFRPCAVPLWPPTPPLWASTPLLWASRASFHGFIFSLHSSVFLLWCKYRYDSGFHKCGSTATVEKMQECFRPWWTLSTLQSIYKIIGVSEWHRFAIVNKMPALLPSVKKLDVLLRLYICITHIFLSSSTYE